MQDSSFMGLSKQVFSVTRLGGKKVYQTEDPGPGIRSFKSGVLVEQTDDGEWTPVDPEDRYVKGDDLSKFAIWADREIIEEKYSLFFGTSREVVRPKNDLIEPDEVHQLRKGRFKVLRSGETHFGKPSYTVAKHSVSFRPREMFIIMSEDTAEVCTEYEYLGPDTTYS